MPYTIYLDDEVTSLLNRFMAIYNIDTYEKAIEFIVKEYYKVVFGDDNVEGDRQK